MYSIILSKKAKNQLKKLDKDLQKRITSYLERIKIRPYYFVKKIEGSQFFRARVGKYRLILNIQNEKLIIYVIELGLRKNIYK
jgi:mRNA interferase RelE/StbE